jgi:hypothetical protein
MIITSDFTTFSGNDFAKSNLKVYLMVCYLILNTGLLQKQNDGSYKGIIYLK